MIETRGRIGGYGRTGRFIQIAEFDKWYDSQTIMKVLNDNGDNAKYGNAKTVFESLDRAKCHSTKRRCRAKRPQIMLLKPVHKVRPVPDELLNICGASIKDYLTTFMLTSHMGAEVQGIRREYRKNDKNLRAIAMQHKDKLAINFDGAYYSIAGWEMVDNIVRVLFKVVPVNQLYVDHKGKHRFT